MHSQSIFDSLGRNLQNRSSEPPEEPTDRHSSDAAELKDHRPSRRKSRLRQLPQVRQPSRRCRSLQRSLVGVGPTLGPSCPDRCPPVTDPRFAETSCCGRGIRPHRTGLPCGIAISHVNASHEELLDPVSLVVTQPVPPVIAKALPFFSLMIAVTGARESVRVDRTKNRTKGRNRTGRKTRRLPRR
jgi:hypothetical protein